MPSKRATLAERQTALDELRKLIHDGDTIYLILRSVSRSGMQRVITPLLLRTDAVGPEDASCAGCCSMTAKHREGCRASRPEPWYIGRTAALVLGRRWDDKREGIVCDGCGMDMGFELVYSLSRCMFDGDGYALSRRWL